jgi:phenylacetate-coenzyme A ligase PaaK-like adenylate-forming protein
VQCGALSGYHLREADLYFEIVDPGTGRVVKEGDTGEIVFTTLTRVGMPLIRYRTGDLSRFLPGKCPCKTQLRSMDVVRGRASGRVKIGDGFLSISEIDEVLFLFDGVVDYQAKIESASGVNRLHIDLKLAETCDAKGAVHAESIQQALRAIPAIKKGFPGRSQIVGASSENAVPFSLGISKRKIIDNR